jgi:hypothetical protein
MKVLLAGPLETGALARATGIDLTGLPAATTQTPLAPLAGGLLAAGHQVHILTMIRCSVRRRSMSVGR